MPTVLTRAAIVAALLLPVPASAARKGSEPPTATCPTGPKELVDAYNAAVGAFNAGRLEEATDAVLPVTTGAPDCADGWGLAGVIWLRRNDPTQAVAALQRALELRPDAVNYRTALSYAAFARQDFATARAAAAAALATDPASLDAANAMLAVDLREGDYAHARATLDAAARTQPRDEVDCMRTRIDVDAEDIDAAEKHVAACRRVGNEAQYDVTVAAIARARGDLVTAGKHAAAVGADTISIVNMAQAAYDRGDHAGAIALLDPVIAERPDMVDARLVRGLARFKAGDAEGAAADFGAARAGGPWIDVERSGAFTGVVTARSEANNRDNIAAAADNEILALLDLERWDDAAARIAERRAAGSTSSTLPYGEARIAIGRHDPDVWARLDAARAAPENASSIEALAARIAYAEPASVPPAWQERLASGTAPARQNVLAGLSNAERWEDCWRLAAPTLREPATFAKGEVHRLAARCALELGRTDDALPVLRALAKAGTPSASAEVTAAQLLADGGRQPEALAVLAEIRSDEPRIVTAVASLRLDCESALNHFDAVVRLARDPAASPVSRANAAVGLLNADRPADALPILQGACPGVPAAAQAWCAEVLASAKERTAK